MQILLYVYYEIYDNCVDERLSYYWLYINMKDYWKAFERHSDESLVFLSEWLSQKNVLYENRAMWQGLDFLQRSFLLNTSPIFTLPEQYYCLIYLGGRKDWEVHEMMRCVRYRKTSGNERLWFMHMWVSGWSMRSIALRTDRSPTTVRRWLRRLLQKHRSILLSLEDWPNAFLSSAFFMNYRHKCYRCDLTNGPYGKNIEKDK